MCNTTHGADAISEYDEIYASPICNTLHWNLGAAGLLTDDFKPLIPSRIIDRTKDDKVITELWKRLEFLAWFPL